MSSSIEKAIDRLNKTRKKNIDEPPVDCGVSNDQLISENVDSTGSANLRDTQVSSASQKSSDAGQATVPTEESVDFDINKLTCELNLPELEKAGYLTPSSKNKVLSEEYRGIKRPILMNAFGKGAAPVEHGNLVAITSSLPGEGKTYTTMNLALSIATELDSTVLVVDGDILQPQLSILLGLEKNKGLTDVLQQTDVQISDVIVTTQIPKLKIIPAGNRYENSTELLASSAMENLVEELGSRYTDRVVLFDTPPLLATSEASVLNHLMGQIILVVEAGKTPVDAIKDALSETADNKVVGLILNKTNGQSRISSYGKYGKYG